jgi:hypothetical protein
LPDVAERTSEELRAEIAAEREGLREDVIKLNAEVRRLAPFAIAGIVVVALLATAVFVGIRKLRTRRARG